MIISENQLDILKKLALREIDLFIKKNPHTELTEEDPVLNLKLSLHKDFFELEMLKASPAWQEFLDRTMGMFPEFKNFLKIKREEVGG